MKTRRTDSSARKLATAPAMGSGARRAAVDTSDIPPLTEEFFERAVRNPYPRLGAATLDKIRKRLPQRKMTVKEKLF